MNKKVAFVANTSWSLYNFRIGVIRSLVSSGYRVYTIAPRDEYSTKLIAAGTTYIDLSLDNYSQNPLADIRLTIHLFRLYRRHGFDTVFHYTIKPNIYGSIAAHWAGIDQHIAITTGLGRMFRFRSAMVNRLVNRLYEIACECTDQVWFLNSHDRDAFVTNGIAREEKSAILPSEGIDTDKYRPLREKVRPHNVTRFLYAGRLLREKGIYEYVAAARAIKKQYGNVKFEILGYLNPHNREAVSAAQITQWQNEGVINYLGSTEDVRPYIDRADAVVLPTYYQEGMSRILLEAGSMATPAITTDHVGCKEIVADGINGILCQPQSVVDLKRVIHEFLAMSWTDQIRMGQRGRSLVKDRFAEEWIVAHYRRVLENETEVYQTTP